MSIARGWGEDGHKHRWEDYIRDSTNTIWRSVVVGRRKEKIQRIFDVNNEKDKK